MAKQGGTKVERLSDGDVKKLIGAVHILTDPDPDDDGCLDRIVHFVLLIVTFVSYFNHA